MCSSYDTFFEFPHDLPVLMSKNWLRFTFHRDHLCVVIIALALTGAFGALFDWLGLKNPYQKSVSANSLSETVFQGEQDDAVAVADNIIVVDLGTHVNRNYIAGVLQTLSGMEPIAVGIDAVFPQPSDHKADSCLTSALTAMRQRVVMARMTDEDGNTIQSYFADSLDLKSGSALLDIDQAGVVHTFCPVQQDGDTAMVALLNNIWNDHYGITQSLELRKTPLIIDYNAECRIISAEQLQDYAEDINGRIVLIGVASNGTDVMRVPSRRAYMPGVEIHAACLETLHNTTRYPIEVNFLINLLIAFALSYAFEVLLTAIQTHLPQAQRPWAVFFREWLRSSYLTNIVLVPLLTILTIIMINATIQGRFYNFTLIFTAIVLVPESRNIYKAALAALRVKYNFNWIKQSLL